jgi:hypothetical protein
MTFYHPKYYKELRKRNTDQAISPTRATASSRRATGPGLKLQAREDSTVNRVAEPQASSAKHQASSVKPQAPEETSDKRQAPSNKPQA